MKTTNEKKRRKKSKKEFEKKDVENIEDGPLNSEFDSHHSRDDDEKSEERPIFLKGKLFLCDKYKEIGHSTTRCTYSSFEDKELIHLVILKRYLHL